MDRVKFIKNNFFIIVVAFLVIFVTVAYTNLSRKRIREYARYTVEQNAHRIASQVDSCIISSRASIQLTSVLASKTMKSNVFEDSKSVIDFLLPSTPFTLIEYIDQDGMNTMYNGETFDASQRVYYREGIKGNSGIWINYSPKLASEYLLNFYTPLYHNDEVVGVLTGALGAVSNILPLMKASFFGNDMIGILCDEKGKVISSTLNLQGENSLGDALRSIGIDEKSVDAFYLHSKYADSSVFQFDGKKGYSYASVGSVEQTGWSVVQIVPSPAFHQVLYRSLYEQFAAIVLIILLFLGYIFYISIQAKKVNRIHEKRETELENETHHDGLTGLFNRRAYEEDLEETDKQLSINNITIIALDVNSLKKVNDTLGHIAGDELIMGAGLCIKQVFSKVGRCYRTGGDEFAVIIKEPMEGFYSLVEEFEAVQKEWQGHYVSEISVSLGIACAKDYPRATLKRLLHIADEQMYENKRDYYATKTSD
ncbi:MAG: GGDEF domain-containing protein [Treponema sp.]|nr:GGDEF domain-containing protein [Candidatus Treponema equifaecale]